MKKYDDDLGAKRKSVVEQGELYSELFGQQLTKERETD
jgi:hypothetical protein